MKNLYPKSKALRWCLTLIALCGIIYGCRKDHFTQTANQPPLTTINADIPELKSIYAKGIKSNALATQSTGKWYNLIHTLNVDWDTYTLQKRNDSSIVAEFDMKDDDALYTLKQLDNKYKNKTTVVFIKRKDGSRLSFFAKVIEDLSLPGSQSVINELHYKNIPGYFNGLVFYYTLDGQFVNGERYIKGVHMGGVTFNETTGGVKINSTGVNNAAAPCTTTDFYFYNCQQLPSGELIDCRYTYIGTVTICDDNDDDGGFGGDDGGGTPPSPPCIPTRPPVTEIEVVKSGKLVIQNVPPPGTGGGGTTPTPGVPCPPTTPPPVVPPVEDTPVEDPCAQAKKLVQDIAFKSKMNDLKSKTGLTNEVGYYTNTDGNYNYVQGVAGEALIKFTVSSPISSYIHTHYTGTFPAFSMADVKSIYELQKDGNIVDINTFTAGVVTASGTTYIMKISDPTKFAAFAATNLKDDASVKVMEQFYSFNQSVYNRNNDYVSSYELALLKTLENSGLTVMKGNSDFSSWDTLTKTGTNTSTDQIKIVNCN